jgi:hypothetical protein
LDEDKRLGFLVLLHVAFMTFPTSLTNFGESSWRVVMVSDRTVAYRETNVVEQPGNAEVKERFSFFASVSVTGRSSGSFYSQRERQRSATGSWASTRGRHIVWKRYNGWCDIFLVSRDPAGLRTSIEAEQIVLIVDQLHAHDSATVDK